LFTYTKFSISEPLSRKPKGRGNLGKDKAKLKEAREMGAPSSYLTGLLHNFSFALRYFESNHDTSGPGGVGRGPIN
jgi:hypothetical protein